MENDMIAKELHDGVLKKVEIEWSSGTIKIFVDTVKAIEKLSNSIVIVCTDFQLFECPRVLPWGYSESINEVEIEKIVDERYNISVELQSGDLMKVNARTIELKPDNP